METKDVVRAALYGLLVGDALGVPYEFSEPEDVPSKGKINMQPPSGFQRAHQGTPPGTWSDDGALSLCLFESLLEYPQFDLTSFGDLACKWYSHGHNTPDGRVFDVGMQTIQGLTLFSQGITSNKYLEATEYSKGNGSLMRCLPVVFFARDLNHAENLATAQSMLTHQSAVVCLCCRLYAVMATNILDGDSPTEAVDRAVFRFDTKYRGSNHAQEAEAILDAAGKTPTGSGYVVDSLWSAVEALTTTSSYKDCVRKAISYGNDTDTTACIAGGLAGLTYGYDGIPSNWIKTLKGKEIVEKLVARYDN